MARTQKVLLLTTAIALIAAPVSAAQYQTRGTRTFSIHSSIPHSRQHHYSMHHFNGNATSHRVHGKWSAGRAGNNPNIRSNPPRPPEGIDSVIAGSTVTF